MKMIVLELLLLFLCMPNLVAGENESSPFYHFNAESMKEGKAFKPYVDVLSTPKNRNVLRDAPFDHLHHHGLMFAIKIDDVNFWEEFDNSYGRQEVIIHSNNASNYSKNGLTRLRAKDEIDLQWMNGEKQVLALEKRKIDVETASDASTTLLTWETVLSLPEGKDKVVLGGNHYHGLGMRFDASMDKGGEFFFDAENPKQETVDAENLTPCRWAAYTTNLNDQPVTVAVFDSPKNPRPMLAFTMGQAGKSFAYLAATINLYREPLEMTKDIRFLYGVAVWEGKKSRADVESVYQEWLAKQP